MSDDTRQRFNRIKDTPIAHLSEDDIKWLIDRVEELELDIESMENERLEAGERD